MLEGGTPDIAHCFFADAAPNTPGPAHRKVLSLRNASITAHATFVAGYAVGDERNNSGANGHRGSAWAAELAASSVTNATHARRAHQQHERRRLRAHQLLARRPPRRRRPGAVQPGRGRHRHLPPQQRGPRAPGILRQQRRGAGAARHGQERTLRLRRHADGTQVGDGNPGPTADGRRKPDIVAVGCGIESATGTACATGTRSACASSYATPHAAGAAALVRQYFTEGWWATGSADAANALTPTGALMRAVLVCSAVDMSGRAGYPNNTEGWGILRLDRALMFTDNGRNLVVRDIRNTFGLRTGENFTQRYTINQAAQDSCASCSPTPTHPGTTGAVRTLVNNLNLRVVDPAGVRYDGNDFDPATGRSRAGSTSAGDAINTIEVVMVDNAAQGVWEITVNATAVTVNRQGFGLAITAAEPPAAASEQLLRRQRRVRRPAAPGRRGPTRLARPHPRPRRLRRRGHGRVLGRLRRVGPPAAALVERSPRLRALRRRVFPRLVAWLTGTPRRTTDDEPGEDQPWP